MEQRLEQVVIRHRQPLGRPRQLDLRRHALGIPMLFLLFIIIRDLGQIQLALLRGRSLGRRVPRVPRGRVVGDGGLGELLERDLVGDVGAAEGAAVDAQLFADGFGEQRDIGAGHVHALDAGDPARVGQDGAGHVEAELVDELVGQVEDQDGGVLDRGAEGGVGVQVGGQGDVGQVFDVLVVVVDQIGEFLRGGGVGGARVGFVVGGAGEEGERFFVDPHLDQRVEQGRVGRRVFGDDFGDGGAPDERRISLGELQTACARERINWREQTSCQSQPPSLCVSDHELPASPCCSFLTGGCRLIVASSWLGRIEGEGGRRAERGAALGLGRRMLWWAAHMVSILRLWFK